ncbi:MAG: NAD(P)H-hydrate epimerase [Dehalococcoidia bacterium]|nr:NAD(P)H-hydrate epimerase [Dehalococcoidia bacterium]
MAVKSDPGGFPQRKASELPAVSAALMRQIQGVAQEEYAFDILQMLENGGRAVATLALAMLGGRGRGQHVVVLAGGGNKGATGMAAVRTLANWGFDVATVFAEVEDEMSTVARRQLQILRNSGIVGPDTDASSEYDVEESLARADLVVDALVGYGLVGPPTGLAAAVTELAAAARRPILAVDVPTGVNATTGEPGQPSIRATTTLTLDLPKKGLLELAARAHVGELYLGDLGIPHSVHQRLGIRASSIFNEGPIVRIRR